MKPACLLRLVPWLFAVAAGCANATAPGSESNGGAPSGTAGVGATAGRSAGTGGDPSSAGQPGAGGRDAGGTGASSATGGSGGAVNHPPDPCIAAGTCPPGTWVNVTPSEISFAGNYGPGSVQADPAHPADVYTEFPGQGIWKSTDYGATWHGPINTGANAAVITGCSGYIRIPPNSTAAEPTIYFPCMEANGLGFWRSTNGGVDWEKFPVNVTGSNNQFYSPAVDPYDARHLLMAGHGVPILTESTDGGETWRLVTIDSGMSGGATFGISFLDTRDPASTRKTWLCMSQAAGGTVGSWRTSDAGSQWTKVETNEHSPGASQIYQPDSSGVVYMAGLYSANGDGIFRSSDYGQTWSHVGKNEYEKLVFGTSRHVYAMFTGVACHAGECTWSPNMQVADPSGTTWTAQATPAAMTQGPTMVTVTNDGTYAIIVTANYGAGLWRYVEP